jgi:hypothetical protein
MLDVEKLLVVHRKDVVLERFRHSLEGHLISVVPVDFVVDEDSGQWKLLVDAAERVPDQRALKHGADSVDLLAADFLHRSCLL